MQDRRLEQDDNLGLGQGVQDNQPTLNIFKISLENIKNCKKRSANYPAGFLTPALNYEYQRLLHPVEKLVWHENDWVGVLPEYGSNRESLPNDIDVAAIRNLKNGKHSTSKGGRKTDAIGLVLHRKYLEECGSEENTSDLVGNLTIFNK